MSSAIYKYPLRLEPAQSVWVPSVAMFLHVGLDGNGIICLWYHVETRAEKIERRIRILPIR